MIKAAVAGALAVAVLASAALFAAVRPFDGEARKSEVAAAVEALVGRSVDIRGPLTLELGWPPRLRAADMRIDEGASISTVELHVAPFALAAGDVEIEGARLIGLELTVDREAMAAAVEALAASDALRRLSVVGGRIDYGAEDASETVALDFELASDAPGGAWLAEGAAVWRGLTFAGAVSLNRPAPGADAAIRARVESGGAVLAFEGAAPRGGVRGRLTLRGEAEDVAPLLAAAGGPAAFAPAPGVGLEADARIHYEDGALTAEDASLRLGRESFSGRLALSADAPRRIDLTLSGGRLDLDALFEDSGASWRGTGEGFPPRRRPGAHRRRFRRRSVARQSRAASSARSGYRRQWSDSAPPVRGAARGVRSLALGSPVVGAGQAAVRRRGRGGFGQSARAPRLDRRRDDGGSRRPSPPLRARRVGGGRPAIRRDFRHRGQSRHHDGFGFGVLRLRPTPGVRAGAAGGPAGRRRLSAARRAGALRDRRADIRCAVHPGDRRSERGPRRDARCTHRRRAGRRRVHAPRGADR